MTNPRTCRIDTKFGHTYKLDGKVVPGVTSILGAESKPHLQNWSAKMVAEYAVENMAELYSRWRQGASSEELVKDISGAARRYTKTAQELGTAVHAECERLIREGFYFDGNVTATRPECQGHVDQFVNFCSEYQPEWVHTEVPVFSRKFRYAGTLDAIARINGETWLVDIKTGNGVYPSVGLQLAAYRAADFYLDENGEERKLPPCTGGVVLHLRSDHYSLVPAACGGEQFNMFLTYRRAWEWADHISQSILGEPWTGPVSEVDALAVAGGDPW